MTKTRRDLVAAAAAVTAGAMVVPTAYARSKHDPMQDTIDKMAIKELFGRYAMAIDTHDAQGYAAVFTENGRMELFGRVTQGREAIAGVISPADGTAQQTHSQHRMYNHVIDVDGDRARSVCQFSVLLARPGSIETIAAGFYKDDVVQVDGEWLIERRQIEIVSDRALIGRPDAAQNG
ncbi:MAG: nuclear transport factor 2 family protein [Acidobacteriota bacterium]|nr:nuclear transport factor 2 family protein [Acidobacteriota bacterium]